MFEVNLRRNLSVHLVCVGGGERKKDAGPYAKGRRRLRTAVFPRTPAGKGGDRPTEKEIAPGKESPHGKDTDGGRSAPKGDA